MEPNLPGGRCRTLIVENDPDVRELLQRLLERFGYQTEVAGTVADGLAKLSWHPCCLLLDLSLPDGYGTTLLRRVREQGLAIRVAVTTGVSEPAVIREARQLGPEAMIFKPLDLNRVLQFLRAAP